MIQEINDVEGISVSNIQKHNIHYFLFCVSHFDIHPVAVALPFSLLHAAVCRLLGGKIQ